MSGQRPSLHDILSLGYNEATLQAQEIYRCALDGDHEGLIKVLRESDASSSTAAITKRRSSSFSDYVVERLRGRQSVFSEKSDGIGGGGGNASAATAAAANGEEEGAGARDAATASLFSYFDPSDASQWTALHVAAYHGHTSCLRSLLEAGAPPGVLDEAHHTPLHVACAYGQSAELIHLLMSYGARPDALTVARNSHSPTEGYGETCLHLACSNGRIGAALAVLDYRPNRACGDRGHGGGDGDGGGDARTGQYQPIDINVRDKFGRTPLHSACRWQRMHSAVILVERGADLDAKDHGGQTPLCINRSSMHIYVPQLRAAQHGHRRRMLLRFSIGHRLYHDERFHGPLKNDGAAACATHMSTVLGIEDLSRELASYL